MAYICLTADVRVLEAGLSILRFVPISFVGSRHPSGATKFLFSIGGPFRLVRKYMSSLFSGRPAGETGLHESIKDIWLIAT